MHARTCLHINPLFFWTILHWSLIHSTLLNFGIFHGHFGAQYMHALGLTVLDIRLAQAFICSGPLCDLDPKHSSVDRCLRCFGSLLLRWKNVLEMSRNLCHKCSHVWIRWRLQIGTNECLSSITLAGFMPSNAFVAMTTVQPTRRWVSIPQRQLQQKRARGSSTNLWAHQTHGAHLYCPLLSQQECHRRIRSTGNSLRMPSVQHPR